MGSVPCQPVLCAEATGLAVLVKLMKCLSDSGEQAAAASIHCGFCLK